MSVRDLIPWNRGNNQAPTIYRGGDMDPFLSLHRDVNRLFDEVLRGFDAPSLFGAHDLRRRHLAKCRILGERQGNPGDRRGAGP